MSYTSDDPLFKHLSDKEVLEFKQAARETFKAGDLISALWHPVYREECKKIDRESKHG
jgi:hypothetical protein